MFAKIFEQIFDSSIAKNYKLRHFFEDILKLANREGIVDITQDAISRRINLPLEEVVPMLAILCAPDNQSRSKDYEGRRLIPLDFHRDWGWKIVNYEYYREIRDEEARKAYFRDAQRRKRARDNQKKKAAQKGKVNGAETEEEKDSRELKVIEEYPHTPFRPESEIPI